MGGDRRLLELIVDGTGETNVDRVLVQLGNLTSVIAEGGERHNCHCQPSAPSHTLLVIAHHWH